VPRGVPIERGVRGVRGDIIVGVRLFGGGSRFAYLVRPRVPGGEKTAGVEGVEGSGVNDTGTA
jgi:hypothetical protein